MGKSQSVQRTIVFMRDVVQELLTWTSYHRSKAQMCGPRFERQRCSTSRRPAANRWQNVIVELDATTIINHLQGKDFAWRIDSILSNTSTLSRTVDQIEWVHIPRTANSCADWITKQALLECPTNWVSIPKLLYLVFYFRMFGCIWIKLILLKWNDTWWKKKHKAIK